MDQKAFLEFLKNSICKTLFETLFRRTIFIRGKGFRRVNDQLLICQNKTSVENSSSVKDFIIDRFFTKTRKIAFSRNYQHVLEQIVNSSPPEDPTTITRDPRTSFSGHLGRPSWTSIQFRT